MKNIFIACPVCRMPLNLSENLQGFLDAEKELVLHTGLDTRIKCDMCGKVTVQISIEKIEESAEEISEDDKLVN
jgi:hypothetical protein